MIDPFLSIIRHNHFGIIHTQYILTSPNYYSKSIIPKIIFNERIQTYC